MAPLPPVRRRTDYSDVKNTDLVAALFSDRVLGGADAMQPSAIIRDATELLETGKSLSVFKDATGAWRWLAVSSTAFRDRDGEIVSTKALAADCDRADADGQYGPLRWWHTPGLDLGDCDFNALTGRSLIESGTFRSASIAEKVARAAVDLELSIGFLHPDGQPDADGVFHHIRRFERSLTPRGKASNLFTSFTVKEEPMALNDIKRAALKALGFGDTDIADLETRALSTEKAADAQGVAYKAADTETETTDTTEVAVEVEGDYVGDMNKGDFEAFITPLITSAVAAAMGGMAAKTEEVAAAVATKAARADAERAGEIATLKAQQATLATKLATLEGDTPAGAPGYRASSDAATVLPDGHALKGMQPAADPLLAAADRLLGLI